MIGLGLVLWKLPEPKHTYSTEAEDETKTASKLARVDFAGAITLVGAVFTGLLSLDLATKQRLTPLPLSLAVLFVVFLVSFVLAERSYAKEPILPLDLVSRRDVLTSYLIVGFQSAGQFGVSASLRRPCILY